MQSRLDPGNLPARLALVLTLALFAYTPAGAQTTGDASGVEFP